MLTVYAHRVCVEEGVALALHLLRPSAAKAACTGSLTPVCLQATTRLARMADMPAHLEGPPGVAAAGGGEAGGGT